MTSLPNNQTRFRLQSVEDFDISPDPKSDNPHMTGSF